MSHLPIIELAESTMLLQDVALRKKSRPIDVESSRDLATAQTVIREMFRAMYSDPSSVGLSAPQIGLLLRISVLSYHDRDTQLSQLMALINPTVTSASEEMRTDTEICLSIPGFSGEVARPTRITVNAYDQHGMPVTLDTEGFLSTVIQHEIDHLDGVLYVDKVVGELIRIPEYAERRTELSLKKLGLPHHNEGI